jgi:hypothetical protein
VDMPGKYEGSLGFSPQETEPRPEEADTFLR